MLVGGVPPTAFAFEDSDFTDNYYDALPVYMPELEFIPPAYELEHDDLVEFPDISFDTPELEEDMVEEEEAAELPPSHIVVIRADSAKAFVNTDVVPMSAPAMLKGAHIFVPVESIFPLLTGEMPSLHVHFHDGVLTVAFHDRQAVLEVDSWVMQTWIDGQAQPNINLENTLATPPMQWIDDIIYVSFETIAEALGFYTSPVFLPESGRFLVAALSELSRPDAQTRAMAALAHLPLADTGAETEDIPDVEPDEEGVPEIESDEDDIPEAEPDEEDVPEVEPDEEDVPEAGPDEEDAPEGDPNEEDVPETEYEIEDTPETDSDYDALVAPHVGILPFDLTNRAIIVQEGSDRAIRIEINNHDFITIETILPTLVQDGSTFLPVAALANLLGDGVTTITGPNYVDITMGAQRVRMTANSEYVELWYNGVQQPSQTLANILGPDRPANPVRTINGHLYAPARALMYALTGFIPNGGGFDVVHFTRGPGPIGDPLPESQTLITTTPISRGDADRLKEIITNLFTSAIPSTLVVMPETATLTIDRTNPDVALQFPTQQMTATVGPAGVNATSQRVLWESLDPGIATVDANGIVTPVSTGTARIRATTVVNQLQAVRYIVVRERAHTVTLNTPPTLYVQGAISETFSFTPTIQPTNAINQILFWSSSNTNVATVDQDGRVTAINAGTTTIRALIDDSHGLVFGEQTVTVAARATDIVLSRSTLTLHMRGTVGETEHLLATVIPTTAVNAGNIVWTSTNPAVATVDASGNVTATGTGTATIRATIPGTGIFPDVVAECVVTVHNLATGITLNESHITLLIEGDQFDTQTLLATIIPADAINRDVTWEVDDPNIAMVDQAGRVDAMNPSETIVRVQIDGTDLYAECIVYVRTIPTGLTLDGSSWTLVTNNDARRSVTLNVTADDPGVSGVFEWSSDDPSVATVDANGTVTAVGVGMTFIRVTLVGTNHFAVARIRVVEEVTGITLPHYETLEINGNSFETKLLEPTIIPDTATEQRVRWTTSDDTIVRVDQSGHITAVRPGTATITATTVDGGFTAQTVVTVTSRVTHVLVDQTRVYLTIFGDQIDSVQLIYTVLPEHATDRVVLFSGFDPAVISVSPTGYVVARDRGETDITIRARDNGIYAETRVTVIVRVVGLELSSEHIALTPANTAVKETYPLHARIDPPNATNQTVRWTSSNEAVARVDANGLVTAVRPGNATITATLEGITASATVTVEPEIVVKYGFAPAFVNGTVMPNGFYGMILDDGVAMMPLRVLMDALAGQSQYSCDSRSGTARIYMDDGLVVNFSAGRPSMYVRQGTNPEARLIPLNRSPRLIGGRMYVPLRDVMEGLGWSVHWCGEFDGARGARYALLTRVGLNDAEAAEKIIHARHQDNLNIVPLEGVRIDPPIGGSFRSDGSFLLPEGETRTLRGVVLPDVPNVESRWLEWTSSNQEIISVNPRTGELTGHQPGTATITVRNGRGHISPYEYRHTASITVRSPSTIVVMPGFERGLVNNRVVDYTDNNPTAMLRDGNTFIAVRAIAEALPDAVVEWDNDNRRVTIQYGDKSVSFTIGNQTYTLSTGVRIGTQTLPRLETGTLPAAPFMQYGRTFVPIRNLLEALGFHVDFISRFNNIQGETYIVASEQHLCYWNRRWAVERAKSPENWNLVNATHVTLNHRQWTFNRNHFGLRESLWARNQPHNILPNRLPPYEPNAASRIVSWANDNQSAAQMGASGIRHVNFTVQGYGRSRFTATSVYPNVAPVTVDIIVLRAPTNLQHNNSFTHNSVRLTWGASSAGVQRYYIYNHNTNQRVATTTATSHTISGLSPNTPQAFRVYAATDTGTSLASWPVWFTTRLAPPSLRVTGQERNSISLAWNAVSGAWGYRVERLQGNSWVYVATVTGTTRTVTGLAENTSHQFRARAQFAQNPDWARDSVWSATVTGRTTAPAPPPGGGGGGSGAPGPGTGGPGGGANVITWPVPGFTRVTSLFGPRPRPGGFGSANHQGIDIAGGGIYGVRVVAMARGTVVRTTWSNIGYGNQVIIDHGNGYFTQYAHLASISVRYRQEVPMGWTIGRVGSTGASTGAHLHFALRRGTANGFSQNNVLSLRSANTRGGTIRNATYLFGITSSPHHFTHINTNAAASMGFRPAIVLVTGVTITSGGLTLPTGNSVALTATVTPSNATNTRVTWSSNNEDVVRVDTNGRITGRRAGTAVVTVTTECGNRTARVTVIVPRRNEPMSHQLFYMANFAYAEWSGDFGDFHEEPSITPQNLQNLPEQPSFERESAIGILANGWEWYASRTGNWGFSMDVFRRPNSGRYDYVFAFRGTASRIGWANNLVQIGLNGGGQAEEAVREFISITSRNHNNINRIYFTGHSLGGYLTQYMQARVIDSPGLDGRHGGRAISFSSPGFFNIASLCRLHAARVEEILRRNFRYGVYHERLENYLIVTRWLGLQEDPVALLGRRIGRDVNNRSVNAYALRVWRYHYLSEFKQIILERGLP